MASPTDALAYKAACIMQEEIQKRTGIRLAVAPSLDAATGPVIIISIAGRKMPNSVPAIKTSGKPEGYSLVVDRTARKSATVVVIGDDGRGAIFGAGRLLRSLHMGKDMLTVDADLKITDAPIVPMRGHQLGYRDTANAYDAWDLALYEQYIRELAIFGVKHYLRVQLVQQILVVPP